MAYVARKPLTLRGKKYRRGETVSMEGVSPDTRRKLVDQRWIVQEAGTPKQPKGR